MIMCPFRVMVNAAPGMLYLLIKPDINWSKGGISGVPVWPNATDRNGISTRALVNRPARVFQVVLNIFQSFLICFPPMGANTCPQNTVENKAFLKGWLPDGQGMREFSENTAGH